MKPIFTILFILTCYCVYSQDTLKIRKIDSLASYINNSNLPIQRDTLNNDRPDMGLKARTYLEMIVNGGKLFKYANNVNMTITASGVTRQLTTSTIFYYDNNVLIKVEEFAIEGDKKVEYSWYYSEGKLFYHKVLSIPFDNTLESDKSEDRANLLLTMSKAILKQVIK